MRTSHPSVCAVLAVTSTTAFLDLKGVPNLIRAYESLSEAFPSRTIHIVSAPENAEKSRELLEKSSAAYELLICNPQESGSLSIALLPFLRNYASVLIHDASRPLVDHEQFERVFSSFTAMVDAVRPAIAFTETLKVLGPSSEIKETLDRSSVKRVSTPELIRTSAIQTASQNMGWFLPLKDGARTEHIEGSALGLRINTTADREMLELFLD